AKLVDQYLGAWGSGEALTADVRWLVENHLLLSTAAFRQNPQAQSTWKRLFQRGVEGRRLTLLALFTAIDIRATNPEAWTPWKAQLLNNLVKSMNSPEAVSLHRHLAFIKRKKLKVSEETLLALDPLLMQMVAPKILLEDLEAARKAKEDLPVKIWRAPNKRVWIRFHRREDKPGLFFGFVRKLFGLGLSIQLSSVHTLPDVGVYDWFCVRTEKPTRQIAKWLSFESSADGQTLPKVQFQSVELIAQDEDEWILSFRGKDQRGLLLTAASVLFEEGLSLRWARAHTWGQQVEDVFAVRPFGEVEERLARLQIKLVT
ncbi:MAG TPA: protein-PII uridylyltransferase, partial [Bdellovibrionales bacterium]|nr:protein-PII uridylyltransferase [Bdellovibrionales bacterium]